MVSRTEQQLKKNLWVFLSSTRCIVFHPCCCQQYNEEFQTGQPHIIGVSSHSYPSQISHNHPSAQAEQQHVTTRLQASGINPHLQQVFWETGAKMLKNYPLSLTLTHTSMITEPTGPQIMQLHHPHTPWPERDRECFLFIIALHLKKTVLNFGLSSHVCMWIKDFLSNRPQTVIPGSRLSMSHSMKKSQRFLLSSLLYSFNTSDCTASHLSNTIKFVDDTTVADHKRQRDGKSPIWQWLCNDSILTLNIKKTNYFWSSEVQGWPHSTAINR